MPHSLALAPLQVGGVQQLGRHKLLPVEKFWESAPRAPHIAAVEHREPPGVERVEREPLLLGKRWCLRDGPMIKLRDIPLEHVVEHCCQPAPSELPPQLHKIRVITASCVEEI